MTKSWMKGKYEKACFSDPLNPDDSPGDYAQKTIRFMMLVNPKREQIRGKTELRQKIVEFIAAAEDENLKVLAFTALENDCVNIVFDELSSHPGIVVVMGWAGYREAREESTARAKEKIKQQLQKFEKSNDSFLGFKDPISVTVLDNGYSDGQIRVYNILVSALGLDGVQLKSDTLSALEKAYARKH